MILYNPLDFYPCSLLFRRKLSRKSTIATDEKHAYFASLISLSGQGKKTPSQGGEKKVQCLKIWSITENIINLLRKDSRIRLHDRFGETDSPCHTHFTVTLALRHFLRKRTTTAPSFSDKHSPRRPIIYLAHLLYIRSKSRYIRSSPTERGKMPESSPFLL